MFSENFLVTYTAEPSPYLFSASEFSESAVIRQSGPLFCICEDEFCGPQHVGLSFLSPFTKLAATESTFS